MKVIISEEQLKLIVEDKKKSKKKDKKNDFDRVSFYFEYYKNLTPSNFDISKKDDEIIIKIPKTK
jgi:hypothetical protein